MNKSELQKIIREEVRKVIKETYYNPGWKLSAVQDWIETYAMNNRLNFKLVHKTNKNSTIGSHAKNNTYYVYDIGSKYGIVVRNEKVPGAPRLDQLYVIAGPKGSTLGSLIGAKTLSDGSEKDLYDMLDIVLKSEIKESTRTIKEAQQPKLEVGQIWFYPYPFNGKKKYYTKIYKIDNKGVSFIESPELTKLTSSMGLDATMPVKGFVDLILRGKAYLVK